MNAPLTSEPNLADYIEKWSKKYLAPSAQEMGAREEYTADLARYLRGEIKRLESQQAMRPASTSSNPLVMTPSEIARFLADCRTLIAHSRTFYEVRDALSNAVWLIERNMRPDETSRDDAIDAAKWRALRNCARITAMGCAGLTQPHNVADDYAHLTLNFWTGISDGDSGPGYAREWLDKFVAKALRSSPEEPSEQPPVETGLRTGELAQLRRIDAAARFYVDSVKPGTGLAWENLMNAIFDGRPEKAK